MKRTLLIFIAALFLLAMMGMAFAEDSTTLSLTLEEAISYGELHSLQMKVAAEDLAEAKAKLREEASIFWPTLDVTISGTKLPENSGSSISPLNQAIIDELIQNDSDLSFINQLNNMSGSSPDWVSNTNASLSQLIFSAPAYQKYKITKQSYNHSLIQYTQIREELAYNITNIFISVSKAKEGIRIAEEALALAEKNLKMTQAFFDAGIIVKTDVLKMELGVSNARQALLGAEIGYQTANSLLKQVLGFPQDKTLEIVIPQSLPTTSVLEGINPPYNQRYDWQMAQIRRQMAETGVKLAKSGYLPMAFLSYDYQDTEYDKFSPEGGDSTFTLGIKWSFSFGGKTHSQVKQAEASLKKAKLHCESIDQTAAMEVLQARLGYTETQKRMEIAALSLKIAQENSTLAIKRYEAGVGTTLEVSDAQVALEQAKYNELTARYDHYLSGLKLEKALGLYRRNPIEGSDK